MIYALDTNTVSFICADDADVVRNYKLTVKEGHQLVIPKVVDYEIKRGLDAKKMYRRMREYLIFCQYHDIQPISNEVWERAVNVYAWLSQKGKPIGDGDTLIAAFCLTNNFTLVTDNIRHFENVDGLNIVNWKN